ncbi:MAG: hypothetical protein R3301_09360 [Saprospiraceae bacterium]|nr:hypothetical protein [Saprospiraceae bacterium]
MNISRLSLALTVFFALVWASCVPDSHTPQPEQILLRGNLHGKVDGLASVSVPVADDAQEIALRNPNSSASGHYLTNGGHTITLMAMENPGGVHGQGHITGPIYLDVELDMACVTVSGNRATVGGEILSVDLGDNPLGLPIEPGWIFYLAVEDNGEGANAASDRHHSFVYFGMPGFGLFCDILNPNNPVLWPEGLWFDIGPAGQIQVK